MSYEIIYSDELAHHGILGMKWGVRRYQNADGSLTREGMKRYNTSKSRYESAKKAHTEAKEQYKENKTDSNKANVKNAKAEVKSAKKQLSKDYDQLKKDKMADKGKNLYQQGKTITGNANVKRAMETVAAGSLILSGILYNHGKTNMAMATIATGAGLEALGAIKGLKNHFDDEYLRAYYSHSRK